MNVRGLMAELDTAERLVRAVRLARDAGYSRIDAYSPFSVDGLAEALAGPREEVVPDLGLAGGILGGLIGLLVQYYSWVMDYPINVGGRAHFAWPAFMLVIFEMTVLGAALAAVIGMLVLNGLPRLHHPAFDAVDFERASQDRFFLLIDAGDPKFTVDGVRRFMASLKPLRTSEV